jgi:hypothetical protein
LEAQTPAGETARRTFLAQVIGACVAFLAAVIGIPAVGAAVALAFKREQAEWLSLGSPDAFQEGVPKPVNLTIASRDGWIETNAVKGVWVVRQPGSLRETIRGAENDWIRRLGAVPSALPSTPDPAREMPGAGHR